jgi:hypothetical protein
MSVTAGSSTAGADRDAVYRKIAWRLLPFILICLIVNYLDRVSIGYAKLQFLEARGAAMGIAMINALGTFGGLSGPAIVGWTFQSTGNISSASPSPPPCS